MFTPTSISHSKIVNNSHEVLLDWSLQLQQEKHRLYKSMKDKRVDEFRGVVSTVSKGNLVIACDDGSTKTVPLTERRADQLLKKP